MGGGAGVPAGGHLAALLPAAQVHAPMGVMARPRGAALVPDGAGGALLLPPPMAALGGMHMLDLREFQREIQELLAGMPQIPVSACCFYCLGTEFLIHANSPTGRVTVFFKKFRRNFQ